MKAFSIFHIPVWAFFSRPLYAEIGRTWNGTGLGYLLLFMACCWTITASRLQNETRRLIDRELPAIASQLPAITIKDGKASVAADQPYRIHRHGATAPVAILDTTGATTTLEAPETMVLLTADSLLMRNGPTDTRTFLLKDMADSTLDAAALGAMGERFKQYFVLILYPFMVAGSFAIRALQAVIFAGLGSLLTRRLGGGLGFQALLRLSIAAMTPAILIYTLAFGLGLPVNYFGGIGLVLTAAYLLFGIRACLTPPPDPDVAPPL